MGNEHTRSYHTNSVARPEHHPRCSTALLAGGALLRRARNTCRGGSSLRRRLARLGSLSNAPSACARPALPHRRRAHLHATLHLLQRCCCGRTRDRRLGRTPRLELRCARVRRAQALTIHTNACARGAARGGGRMGRAPRPATRPRWHARSAPCDACASWTAARRWSSCSNGATPTRGSHRHKRPPPPLARTKESTARASPAPAARAAVACQPRSRAHLRPRELCRLLLRQVQRGALGRRQEHGLRRRAAPRNERARTHRRCAHTPCPRERHVHASRRPPRTHVTPKTHAHHAAPHLPVPANELGAPPWVDARLAERADVGPARQGCQESTRPHPSTPPRPPQKMAAGPPNSTYRPHNTIAHRARSAPRRCAREARHKLDNHGDGGRRSRRFRKST